MKVTSSAWEWDLSFNWFFILLMVVGSSAWAELLIKPETALKLRFGEKSILTKKNIALNKAQLKSIQKKARWAVEEKIFTLYEIKNIDGAPAGYASLISDTVRTHTQTVLYFLDTEGMLKGAELIAYYEPPEYKISNKWMNQNLMDKTMESPLRSGDDLPIVTGSTLTTESLARSARLALILWEFTFAKSANKK